MAINQTVLMPQRKDPFDTLLKGLQVAQGIFGIKTALEQSSLKDMQMKALEQEGKLNAQELEAKKFDYENKKRLSSLQAAGIWESKDFNNNFYAVDDDKLKDLSKKFNEYPFQTVRLRVYNPDVKEKFEWVTALDKDQLKEAQKAVDNAAKTKLAEKIANDRNRPKPTSSTWTAAGYAKRMSDSNKILDNLEKDGFDRATFENALMSTITKPFGEVGEFFKSPELKLYDQATRNFINAILRKESGAAIGKDEFLNATQQYFPLAGDTPAVKEQKRQNRIMVQQALENEARYGLTGEVLPALRDAQNAIRGTTGDFDPGISTTNSMMLDMYQNQNNQYQPDPNVDAFLKNYLDLR